MGMTFKKERHIFLLLFSAFLIILIFTGAYANNKEAQESDQQIKDFSISGYGDRGRKSWDLSGKAANILENNVIKLNNVTGNLYGDREQVKLVADKGRYDKTENKVCLNQNVVITTSSGARLTTDSLEWDRKTQRVATQDQVNITRDNMMTQALGAVGEPNLNKVTLQKDVKVDINPAKDGGEDAFFKDKIVITCDGPLEIDYLNNIATFNNNVKVDTQGNTIDSDAMDVYFISSQRNDTKKPKESGDDSTPKVTNTRIDKIVARGNVKITRDKNTSYSQEAIYTALDKKITLVGKPKLEIFSAEGFNASSGD